MLDKETKQNLEQYLALIESPIVFSVSLDTSENSQKLAEFTKEIAEMSPKISWEKRDSMRTPSFLSIQLAKKVESFSLVSPSVMNFPLFYWLCYKLVDGHRKSVNL